MQDRNLQNAAEVWYSSTIQDIEREVSQAEEDKKDALRKKLAKKYFKHKKES